MHGSNDSASVEPNSDAHLISPYNVKRTADEKKESHLIKLRENYFGVPPNSQELH